MLICWPKRPVTTRSHIGFRFFSSGFEINPYLCSSILLQTCSPDDAHIVNGTVVVVGENLHDALYYV